MKTGLASRQLLGICFWRKGRGNPGLAKYMGEKGGYEGFGPPLLITQVDDRIELIDYGHLSSSGKVLE